MAFPFSGLFNAYRQFAQRQSKALSAHRAREQRHEYQEGATSSVYDSGGLATFDETRRMDMHSEGGLYLGVSIDGDVPIVYKGSGSLNTFGRPGIGKGATVIQPNLGYIGNDFSVVVVDVGGENHRVSARYRQQVLRQQVLANNPSALYGIKSITIDPIAHIRLAGARGDFHLVERLARGFRYVLVVERRGDKSDAKWVIEAAQAYIQTLLVFAALEQPALCSLPALFDFVSRRPVEQFEFILAHTRLDYVRNRIAPLVGDLETGADKQLHWKIEKVQSALEPYERGTELGDALSGEAFDPAILRQQPTTLYLIVAESALAAHAGYLACVITSLVEQLSDIDGPQKILFMLDEASQLPAMQLPRWIRSLRKRNIQFWSFWQSVPSMVEVYGQAGATDLQAITDVTQHLSIDDTAHARRLSERSGTRTIFGHSMNRGGDGVSAQDSFAEQSTATLPVAEILNIPTDLQLIERTGLRLLLARRFPWWQVEPFCDRLRHFSEMSDDVRYDRPSPRT